MPLSPDRKRLEEMRRGRFSEAMQHPPPPYVFRNPRKAKDFVPVLATGGIGDLFIAMGVARAIDRRLGMPVRLYHPHSEVAEIIQDNWVGLSPPRLDVDHSPFEGFDWWVKTNCISEIKMQPETKKFPNLQVERLYMDFRKFIQKPWDSLIYAHPQLDGEVAREAVKVGLNREILPYAMFNLPVPTERYRIDMSPGKYDWEPFITVHDGYEMNQPATHRATKTWNIRNFAEAVRIIKMRFPEVMVVQLGGEKSRSIPGVDVSLVGKLPIEESFAVLQKSLLHIDGDSGLVHAATHLGTKCIVVFGPTPADFFGYAENVNLTAGDCGPCFWMHPHWMMGCPLNKEQPSCMDSVSGLAVAEKATAILREKGL